MVCRLFVSTVLPKRRPDRAMRSGAESVPSESTVTASTLNESEPRE